MLSCDSVKHALSSIKAKTAGGPDGLQAFVLKKLAPAISPNITSIFNSSIVHRTFPNEWKKANITPIWKGKGSKSDPTNYRPISVLPIFARVLEKACARQLSEFVESKHYIPDQQFGFRARSSCEHALITGLDSWMGAVDKGEVVGAILVDLSKAFDSVPHRMLLSELSKIACSQNVLAWFFDYLNGREQRVITSGNETPWRSVSRGVPQGSCLSPLLFNIFIRELPTKCNSSTVQFADDVTHAESHSSPQVVVDKLCIAYNQTKTFCEDKELTINPAKSQFIIFKQASKKLPEEIHITLDNCIIKPSDCVQLLGMTLDKHITFKQHIESVVQKCHGLLGVLARSAP